MRPPRLRPLCSLLVACLICAAAPGSAFGAMSLSLSSGPATVCRGPFGGLVSVPM